MKRLRLKNSRVIFFSLIAFPALTQAAGLEINEVMYNAVGSDDGHEWIEVLNTGSTPVTVVTGSGTNSWRMFETSNHTWTLSQGSSTLQANTIAILTTDPIQFLLDYPSFSGTLFKTALALPNTTAQLKLSDNKGVSYFHERSYSSTDGANGDGRTLEWQNSAWQVSSQVGGSPGLINTAADSSRIPSPTPTPAVSASPTNPASSIPAAEPTIITIDNGLDIDFRPELVITEIAYNPAGRDQEAEWLEIQNRGTASITLPATDRINWRFKVGETTYPLTFVSGDQMIAPGRRLMIVQNPEVFQQLYPSLKETLVLKGRFSLPNRPEQLALSTDNGVSWTAVSRYDPNLGGDGDGRTLERTEAGIWQASSQSLGTPGRAASPLFSTDPVSLVIIHEFLPRPEAGNENWIELANLDDQAVDLENWSLDDGPGGSKPYRITARRPDGSTIPAHGWLVFRASETHLSLQTNDAVRLIRPSGEIAQTIPFTLSAEKRDVSWAAIEDYGACWTESPTPAAPNICDNFFHPTTVTTVPAVAPIKQPTPKSQSVKPKKSARLVLPIEQSSKQLITPLSTNPSELFQSAAPRPLTYPDWQPPSFPVSPWTNLLLLGMLGGLTSYLWLMPNHFQK